VNTVDVSVEGVEPPGWLDNFKRLCLKALDELGIDGWEVSVILCDDGFIRGLNARYRNKDEATDVLSFPQRGTGAEFPTEGDAATAEHLYYAGDIVISLDTLHLHARRFSVDTEEELKRLVVHGILHLSGMDHSDNSPEQNMLQLQEATLSRLTEERIF
jgi:probable rRNA maturation factor